MAKHNKFIDPPPQTDPGDYSYASIIQYGSPHTFSWTENYRIPLTLILVQETAFVDDNTLPGHVETLASDLTSTTTTYSWDAKPTQKLTLSNVFWLGMYNASNEGLGPLFKSQYFNVTDSASSSSSSITISFSSTTTSSPASASVSASASSSSSSSTPTTQPITAPTSTTSSASPTPKPHTNHAALSAGLGAGLGGAALILAVALFFLLGRKRHHKSAKAEVYQLAGNDTFSH